MADTSLVKLAEELGNALKAKGWKLALAESCTGGLVSSLITEVPGSSIWFDRGFVTYSNKAKVEMLSVSAQTILQHGAVSEHTATEMAVGALKHSQAQISASITGIAGPDGGSADKPVGMVCFAWSTSDGVLQANTHYLIGSRQKIREQASRIALSGLLSLTNQQD